MDFNDAIHGLEEAVSQARDAVLLLLGAPDTVSGQAMAHIEGAEFHLAKLERLLKEEKRRRANIAETNDV